MNRLVEPEILDELPPQNPDARRARRDLQKINFWMGHAGILREALRENFPKESPRSIAELGAGDGTLLLRVAKKLNWRGVEVSFVDRQPVVAKETVAEFCKLGWNVRIEAADVFEWIAKNESVDVIMANLFLHHFEPEQLKELFENAARRTKFFTACEPHRTTQNVRGCRLLWLIGCGFVARNDAVISVRAGFDGKELSALWPANENWIVEERKAGFFSHLFFAKNKSSFAS